MVNLASTAPNIRQKNDIVSLNSPPPQKNVLIKPRQPAPPLRNLPKLINSRTDSFQTPIINIHLLNPSIARILTPTITHRQPSRLSL